MTAARRRRLALPAAALATVLATLAVTGCGRDGSVSGGRMHQSAAESLPAVRATAALEACPTAAPEVSGSGGQPGLAPPGLTRPGQVQPRLNRPEPTLPDLTLPCLGAGDPVPLRRLGGIPTVLNLWASWCGPCRQELPAFQRLHANAGSRVRVLGVVTEDPAASALSFAADAGVHFPSVLDETGRLKRALGRSLLPSTVLVSADGRIPQVYTGPPLRYADLVRMVHDRLGVALT